MKCLISLSTMWLGNPLLISVCFIFLRSLRKIALQMKVFMIVQGAITMEIEGAEINFCSFFLYGKTVNNIACVC